MSFSQAADPSSTIGSFDAWLAKVGVSVPKLRRDVAAQPPKTLTPEDIAEQAKAYEAALERVKEADSSIDWAFVGRRTPQLQSDYKAIAVPDPGPGAIPDHAQALAILAPKLELATKLLEASKHAASTRAAAEMLRKLALYESQSGRMPGHEAAYDDIAGLRQQAADKFKQQQFAEEAALLADAKAKAESICLYHDTVFAAATDMPKFKRTQALLAGNDGPPALAPLKQQFEQASADLETAHAAGDGKAMAAAHKMMVKLTDDIFRAGLKDDSRAWLEAQMGKPAPGPGSTPPGIADQLSTGPGFPDMDEKARFEAVAKFVGRAKDQRALRQYQEVIKSKHETIQKYGLEVDLSPSEIAAVLEYSSKWYTRINDLLRGSLDLSKLTAEQLDRTKVVAALITRALEKLPEYQEGAFPVFRWETPYGDHLETRYQVGCVFEVKEFWSTGGGGGALSGANTEIVIWGKKGSRAKDIVALTMAGPSEGSRADGHVLKGQGRGEVLFMAGTKFKTLRFDARDEKGNAVLPKRSGMGQAGMSYRVEVQEL